MKVLSSLLVLLFHFGALYGQRPISPAEELSIEGKVKTELKYTLQSLDTFPAQTLADFEVSNHKGELKGVVTGVKGIALKRLLDKVEFLVEKPRELNEFYFIFIATDGYKVVFSWNEIFNTPIGDNIFIITEKGGNKVSSMDERILLVSTSDLKIGRRYIKNLSRIVVARIE